MTESTDAELEALFVEETGFAIDDGIGSIKHESSLVI